jgi:hypothetical protein
VALTKEDLQAIGALFETEREHTSRMIDSKLEPIKADISELKQRLVNVEENQDAIRQSQLIVENIQFPRIQSALDGFAVSVDKDKEQDKRITGLERKTEQHDIRLYAVENKIQKAL